MAWEWSYTNAGLENILENLHDKPQTWLAECLAEWQATRTKEYQAKFRVNRWEKCLAWCLTLPQDTLADAIYDRAYEQSTCENGGHDAWVCPYGCHTVSLDRERE
jgi:hypothetical protein